MTRHSCIILHCPFFTPIYVGKGVNHSIKRIRYGLLACLQYLQPGWEPQKTFLLTRLLMKMRLAHLDYFMTYFTVAVGEIKIIVIIFVGIKWWHHSDRSCFLHTPAYAKEGNYNIVHLILHCTLVYSIFAVAKTADKRQTAPRDSITPYFIISIIFWVTPTRLNSHTDELISPHSWLTFTFVLVLMNIQCSLHG